MKPINRSKPVCNLCNSDNINICMNVGYDVDPSGEESQHLDVCRNCGAERFWVERLVNFSDYQILEGQFTKEEGLDKYHI